MCRARFTGDSGLVGACSTGHIPISWNPEFLVIPGNYIGVTYPQLCAQMCTTPPPPGVPRVAQIRGFETACRRDLRRSGTGLRHSGEGARDTAAYVVRPRGALTGSHGDPLLDACGGAPSARGRRRVDGARLESPLLITNEKILQPKTGAGGSFRWWSHGDSNPEPPACKAGALPIAPWPLGGAGLVQTRSVPADQVSVCGSFFVLPRTQKTPAAASPRATSFFI